MPAHSTAPHSAAPAPVALDGRHAADLADLLGCLREWIDAEHDRLDPLLAEHGYDTDGLRTALHHYTALLRSSHDQPPF